MTLLGLGLERKPFVLALSVVLLLNCSLVREFQRFNLLPLLFSCLFGIVLGDSEMVRKYKLSNNLLSGFLPLLLFQKLQLTLVLSDLIGSDPDVVQRHNLPQLKLEEGDTEPDLVSTHIGGCELLCLFWLKSLLDLTLVPHTISRVDSQTSGLIVQ